MRRLFIVVGLAGFAWSCGQPTPENCKGKKVGDLVITEFLSDPDGTDTGSEWIEVFNTTGAAIDLTGVNLYTTKTDGSGLKSHIIKAGKVEGHSYFTFGDIHTGALPPYINYTYGADLGSLANSAGVIGLKCGAAITFDEVQYSITPKAAHARQLDGRETIDSIVNDNETKWCDSPVMLAGTAHFGTPGQPNVACPVYVAPGNCLEPGGMTTRPLRPPAPGQLFITEVMSNPSFVGDTEGEWIELHSSATSDVDLNDVVLSVNGSNHTFEVPECLNIPAGGYAVVGHETDAGVNGGLPGVMATFSASLGNSGSNTISLSVNVGDAGLNLDTANYNSSLNGISWQLDPLQLDSVSNDDAGSFCPATVRYGDPDAGDFGTPGALNTLCPPVFDPNICNDNGTMRPIVPPAPGSMYVTEVMADPKAASDAVGEWLELKSDSTADLNGLVLTVGTSKRTLLSLDCLSIPAGGFALLGHGTGDAGLPALTTTFTQGLGNAGGTITLALADAGIIDVTTYPAAASGVAWQLSPAQLSAVGNDDPMNYCRATRGYPEDGGDLGTPKDVNTACPVAPNPNDCVDPNSGLTRPIVKPVLGDLVITEIMPDPAAVLDTAGEYVELLANASFDLNGLTLANETTGMSSVSSQVCLPVTAGTYSVFAHSVDPLINGNLPTPAGTFTFALANSAATGPRQVVVRSGTSTLDTWSYTTSTSGASWQLKPGLVSPDDNEDAGSVCVTPMARYGMLSDGGIGGDRGTPGLVNENCP